MSCMAKREKKSVDFGTFRGHPEDLAAFNEGMRKRALDPDNRGDKTKYLLQLIQEAAATKSALTAQQRTLLTLWSEIHSSDAEAARLLFDRLPRLALSDPMAWEVVCALDRASSRKGRKGGVRGKDGREDDGA